MGTKGKKVKTVKTVRPPKLFNKRTMTIMLDNGHGQETPGKASPDGRLQEWKWAREMVGMIKEDLTAKGYDVVLVTPEDTDISLSERCRRVNDVCNSKGAKNVLVVSVHVNAFGNGWTDPSGFLSLVSFNASNDSKKLAKAISDEAYKMGLKGNRWVPEEGYRVQDLMICRDTKCPAVLTENMFMTNEQDVEFLLSDEGKQMLCEAHVTGIRKYISPLSRIVNLPNQSHAWPHVHRVHHIYHIK